LPFDIFMPTYTVKGPSLEDLNAELDKFWVALKTNATLRSDVESSGVDLASLHNLDWRKVIKVQPAEAHFDPATLSIIVAFSPTINAVATSVWEKFALPWLLKKFGKDSIQ
jgi:hypothetical protein